MATILVIRADDSFSQLLREAGFNVDNLELIETRPIGDLTKFRARFAKLSKYDGIFFPSPVAAEIFVKEFEKSNGFGGTVYALGRRARLVLESAGMNVKSPPDSNTADEMLEAFGNDEFAGRCLLYIPKKRYGTPLYQSI